MIWHDLRDPADSELDRLAELYKLHQLHIEDCRHGRQRAKVEEGEDYVFVVLKPVEMDLKTCELDFAELDVFLGPDYVITVMEVASPTTAGLFDQLRKRNHTRPDQLFHRIFDYLVDSYMPLIDAFGEEVDRVEDRVLDDPNPELLQQIFALKRSLIELRRVLGNSRDVAAHLQRTEIDMIQPDMLPFMRDVYDHLARAMDLLESHRDLLTSSLDIYLSSVANRTNQVMKVLTVLGTVALPSIVVSGFFGMNTKDLPWTQTPMGTWYPLLIMVFSTLALLMLLRRMKWL